MWGGNRSQYLKSDGKDDVGLVRLRKCCLIAILNVVGFGVNFCSVSSFQTLGRAKYGSFFIWSVLAKGI